MNMWLSCRYIALMGLRIIKMILLTRNPKNGIV
jgi:hypothetical protein